jgi:hypothetical protein
VLAVVLHLCQVLGIFSCCGQFYCTHYSAQLCHACSVSCHHPPQVHFFFSSYLAYQLAYHIFVV